VIQQVARSPGIANREGIAYRRGTERPGERVACSALAGKGWRKGGLNCSRSHDTSMGIRRKHTWLYRKHEPELPIAMGQHDDTQCTCQGIRYAI
jgi:hypothetical protein